jgi:hypothetical protein
MGQLMPHMSVKPISANSCWRLTRCTVKPPPVL